ncbi:hypothetical protein M9Y10_001165 [Tritrichomonas musculus]|uniref:UBA domain-containing protein n=1 Tax=Tritrichomonas musculus TaxID=1915356 RepID=A0ABR2L6D4_9EUKA
MRLKIVTSSGIHPLEINDNDTVSNLREKLLLNKIVNSPDFKLFAEEIELDNNSHLKNYPHIESKQIKIEMAGESQKELTLKEDAEEEEDKFDDPPNFEKLVKELVDMGFDRKKSIQSLRLSDYRTDYAANMLISGNLQNDDGDDDYDDGEDDYESDDEGHIMSRKNLGQARDIYDQFTTSEKSIVQRLSKKYGIEISEAVQIFSISNKNETEAIAIFEQYKK